MREKRSNWGFFDTPPSNNTTVLVLKDFFTGPQMCKLFSPYSLILRHLTGISPLILIWNKALPLSTGCSLWSLTIHIEALTYSKPSSAVPPVQLAYLLNTIKLPASLLNLAWHFLLCPPATSQGTIPCRERSTDLSQTPYLLCLLAACLFSPLSALPCHILPYPSTHCPNKNPRQARLVYFPANWVSQNIAI